MADASRIRLDLALVARGLVRSRSQGRDLIRRGLVTVDGKVAAKPGALVGADAALSVPGPAAEEVSRGAAKLAAALDAFGFDACGRHALDIGASAGGFTQVLLTRGAAHVTAVDVGHGQLDEKIAVDLRVTAFEGLDARTLTAETVPGPVTAIVADVSYISLVQALPAALKLAAPGCWLVALVKPQFEAGREAIGKGGVVRDETARREAAGKVRNWLADEAGWTVTGEMESPVTGGGGNIEYLIGARKPG